jgi:hypothetical protein
MLLMVTSAGTLADTKGGYFSPSTWQRAGCFSRPRATVVLFPAPAPSTKRIPRVSCVRPNRTGLAIGLPSSSQ